MRRRESRYYEAPKQLTTEVSSAVEQLFTHVQAEGSSSFLVSTMTSK